MSVKDNKWSVSKLHCYESCPRKFQGKYHHKIKDKPGPAAQRGSEVHLKAENYLGGKIRGLPPELEKLGSQYRRLKKTKPLVEVEMAVDVNWKPVGWSKGWGRGIIDALTRIEDEMIIIDHKTGRIYDKHEEQAEVYALLVHATVEEANAFHVEFWYVDKTYTEVWDYTEKELLELRGSYEERVKKMLTAKKFPQTPSESACRWCPVSSKKGGPCNGWKKV